MDDIKQRLGQATGRNNAVPPRTAQLSAPGSWQAHRILIAASIVLPVLMFAIGSYFAWLAAVADAHTRLRTTVDVARENVEHVFETYQLLLRQADDTLGSMPDAEILARERELHDRFAAMIDRLPQVEDMYAFGAQAHPLVSARNYPAPHALMLADRDYFRGIQGNGAGVVLSAPAISRVDNAPTFFVAIPRSGRDGAFQGGVTVAVKAAYFEDYWRRNGLADETPDGMTMVLFRGDGTFLARWPRPIRPGSSVQASASFHDQIARAPEAGSYELRFPDDGIYRILAYHQVENLPLYVVASLRQSSIVWAWLATMSKHLFFGVPATLALLSLAILASRRARREATALALLESESRRREQVEEAFRQSQKMEAIGRLTGGIAHDFNNLLTAIGGSIEYLARPAPKSDERTRRYTAMAREAVQRATTLTHRLLAFARQQPLDMKPVNVNRLVAGMSDLLLRTLGEDIQIETVLAGGLWPTESDAHQLENALLNLAINARDAMPAGGKLTIETLNAHLDSDYAAAHTEVEPGQYVQLAVTDTGHGMPADIVARVFEPFFTTKPVGKGTGLGLSMVYGFVKQSGGHIKIYSEIDRGTTIKVYLPRSRGPAESFGDRAMEAAPAARVQGGKTILVVEDDDAVREFSVGSLQDLGYRVVAARDAASALELLSQTNEVSLLFTDVVLPGGMDGRRLAEQAQALRPGLPVLFTTGYTPNAIIHNGVLDAGVDLLPKPFSAATLATKLGAILGSTRSVGNQSSP